MALSHVEAAKLTLHLTDGSFERSPMGAILDRAETFAVDAPRVDESEWTARPTSELREQPRSDPDDYLLTVHGSASRRLDRVAKVNPTAAMALKLFYGNPGDAWGRGAYGRVGSVIHLTTSGKRLIIASRKRERGASLDVTDAQRVQTEANLQQVQPLMARGALIKKALSEGAKLVADAEALYMSVSCEAQQ